MKFTYKKSGAKRILPFFPGYHFLNSPMRSVCGEFNGGRGGRKLRGIPEQISGDANKGMFRC